MSRWKDRGLPTAEALAAMDGDALRQVWRDRLATPVPKYASPEILRGELTLQRRLDEIGGWPPGVKRRIDALVREFEASRIGKPKPSTPATRLSAGMRLIRTYKGVAHEVVVLEKGFAWEGKVWPSLSEIATTITGVKWSGPLFFGLRKRAPKP